MKQLILLFLFIPFLSKAKAQFTITNTSTFSLAERMSWAETRKTTRSEDKVYSMLGIFNIYMPLIYGEGEESATKRLREEIDKASKGKLLVSILHEEQI